MKSITKKDYKPHMMYNPKTGEGVKAATYKKHLALKEKGYTHSKPTKSFNDAVEKRMGGSY